MLGFKSNALTVFLLFLLWVWYDLFPSFFRLTAFFSFFCMGLLRMTSCFFVFFGLPLLFFHLLASFSSASVLSFLVPLQSVIRASATNVVWGGGFSLLGLLSSEPRLLSSTVILYFFVATPEYFVRGLVLLCILLVFSTCYGFSMTCFLCIFSVSTTPARRVDGWCVFAP